MKRAPLLTCLMTLAAAAVASPTPAHAEPAPDGTSWLSSKEALSEFETYMPQTGFRSLNPRESRLLQSYLAAPKDWRAAEPLGRLHFSRFLTSLHDKAARGRTLESAILSRYFYLRQHELGVSTRESQRALAQTSAYLEAIQDQPWGALSTDEARPAHELYRRAFHFEEGLRYKAADALLDEYVDDARNVYTAFALNAVYLWTGGESAYDDPTVLYDFALGSYFSVRAIELAHAVEEQWLTDPYSISRFRLAAILGGFSALQRRWLAVLHGNQPALNAIDDEHREWRVIQPAFHSFTVGVSFFDEAEHFQEGLAALQASTAFCYAVFPATCFNRPRYYFNRLGFTLTFVDYYLKMGDVDDAVASLQFRFNPDEPWEPWALGHEPWLHREAYAQQIADLYTNADPSDDPLHFQLRGKQWGTNTMTCQTCHQTQDKPWTKEEFDAVMPTPEPIASVGNWPEVRTTWYAALPSGTPAPCDEPRWARRRHAVSRW